MSKRYAGEKGYWSTQMGLCEFTADDQREVEARKAEVLAKKLAEPARIIGVPLKRLGKLAYSLPSSNRQGRLGTRTY